MFMRIKPQMSQLCIKVQDLSKNIHAVKVHYLPLRWSGVYSSMK